MSTVADRCRDCYRCIRSCPVKAIRIESENDVLRARIVENLCVLCGRCVLTCPQGAKRVSSGVEQAKKLLAAGRPVAASVAPSFAAALPLPGYFGMPALLKALGFTLVQETAWGAELVSRALNRIRRTRTSNRTCISSACPVVVNLVEKHYPGLIPCLAPVVSPMVAHGKWIKRFYPGTAVVFIGPCVAKKEEAQYFPGAVDCVVGFDELWKWLQEEGLLKAKLEPAGFDPPHPQRARLFPVEGGELFTMSLSTDMLDTAVVAISGLKNCIDFLSQLRQQKIEAPPVFAELMACSGGCIGGPLVPAGDDIFIRRQRVKQFFQGRPDVFGGEEDETAPLPLERQFQDRQVYRPQPPAAVINQILAQTGKYRPEDELNCGACGYDSCREKAAAVYWGMAEVQMCIPYMRRRAESMSNLVISAMPNGCIIIDRELKILEINPAAGEMFDWQEKEVTGRHLDQLIDGVNFRRVLATGEPLNVLHAYDSNGRIIREVIFPLGKEDIVVGILIDITHEKQQQEELQKMKSQTVRRAQEVINKQMKVAQEIAGLLGETTAETKVLLSQLIKLMEE
ncbi:histidine kinase [Desulfotomaculum copahuensis]|uniref:Histidine kinase n=1 Tax=Desulfotomaculum copahuensis TaxID=1838280 RepID=A0A1B7LCW5_9FIRM|nr:histidine kinase [Desulfotomaculum copahuensis]